MSDSKLHLSKIVSMHIKKFIEQLKVYCATSQDNIILENLKDINVSDPTMKQVWKLCLHDVDDFPSRDRNEIGINIYAKPRSGLIEIAPHLTPSIEGWRVYYIELKDENAQSKIDEASRIVLFLYNRLCDRTKLLKK